MNILHINSYNSGGGSETVFNITRNNEYNASNFSGFNVRCESQENNSDIRFTSWENNNKIVGMINYIFSINNYVQLKNFLESNPIDIVHLHGFYSSISPSILLILNKFRKKNRIKIVQTIHDFHLICPNASLFNFSQNTLCEKCISRKIKFKIFLDSCDRRGRIFSIIKGLRTIASNNLFKHKDNIDYFIAPSNFIKEKYVQDGIKPEKIIVIRNPIVVKSYEILAKKEDLICYFGRFSSEKYLEFLITSFTEWKRRKSNKFKLILIGEGEKQNDLQQLAKELLIENEVIFKKFIPFEYLINEIKIAKYFTMTSKWYENAPMSILEGVSQGLIPIVPDIGGMKESVESLLKIGKTYRSDSVESWCNVMDFLEENYEAEFEKIISLRKRLIEDYGLNTYKKTINSFYKDLLNCNASDGNGIS